MNEYTIPKDSTTIYRYWDIKDAPRHYYTKIEGKTLIRYSYHYTAQELIEMNHDSVSLFDILPEEIVIANADSAKYFYFGMCQQERYSDNEEPMVPFHEIEMKFIKPFRASLIKNCFDKVISVTTSGQQITSTYRTGDKVFSKIEHKYWRSYFADILMH